MIKKTDLLEPVCKWLGLQLATFKTKSLFIPGHLDAECEEVIRACDNLCFTDVVHLADVRPIAELLELELAENKRDDPDYDIEYSFIYDGVKFISIHKSEDGD